MPVRRPVSRRRRKPMAMTGPAMPSWMPKEPKMDLKPIVYHCFRQYTEIKRWKTGPDSEFETEEIDHEIYTRMK